MGNGSAIVVLGLPIGSSDPVFLALVGIHVLFGLETVVAGAVAMVSAKRRGRHSNWGTAYFWGLVGLVVTAGALSSVRWAEDAHLFGLGSLSLAFAWIGRTAARRKWRQWVRFHLSGMGASYILALTAFYVDNGRNLPLWNELPDLAFWLLPSAIGAPIILMLIFLT